MNTFVAGLLQALAGSAVTIVAFVGLQFTRIGERLLDHRLNERIEGLRSDLAHVEDRGRRANELEFEALTKVWNAYVDAWIKTQQAIVDHMSFPDLNRLSESDLATFLETTELSVAQRQQVAGASDKNDIYSKILRLRKVNSAGASIYDGRQVLRVSGVFVPTAIVKTFREAFDRLSGAQVERYLAFELGRGERFQKSLEVLDTMGTGEIMKLQDLVRSTIRRE